MYCFFSLIKLLFAGPQVDDSVKQMFLDDLLTSYQAIETRFAKHLYQFYKSYEFRSLWDLSDRITAFQRRASDAAKGTGKLQGVVELTKAMQEIGTIESDGQKCMTRLPHKFDTLKWSFNNVKDKVVCNYTYKKGQSFTRCSYHLLIGSFLSLPLVHCRIIDSIT